MTTCKRWSSKIEFKGLLVVIKKCTCTLRLEKPKGWKKYCNNINCETSISDL